MLNILIKQNNSECFHDLCCYCLFIGYQAISKRHDKPDEDEEYEVVRQEAADKRAFDMPELLHNLNLLVDMAEEEIIQNDRQ